MNINGFKENTLNTRITVVIKQRNEMNTYEIHDVDDLSNDLTEGLKKDYVGLAIAVDGSPASTSRLTEYFVVLQRLYRPLMRKRNSQVWVIWFNSSDAVCQAGAEALTQIAAMELAKKGLSINFVGMRNTIADGALLKLFSWQDSSYMTAQNVEFDGRAIL